jgi:hypothetical protein
MVEFKNYEVWIIRHPSRSYSKRFDVEAENIVQAVEIYERVHRHPFDRHVSFDEDGGLTRASIRYFSKKHKKEPEYYYAVPR